MTAAYGLPDHLIDPAAYAVRVAWDDARTRRPDWSVEFEGTPLHTLTALWWVRVENEIHTDLLSPSYVRGLLRVVEVGVEINALAIQDTGTACFRDDFGAALALDLRAEELILTLQDLAHRESVSA
jgi:hypothetical protein